MKAMLSQEIAIAVVATTVTFSGANHVAGLALALPIAFVVAAAVVSQSLLFPWSEFFGHRAEARRTKRKLHRTRELCIGLEQKALQSSDEGAPIQHLRAAAQHLNMVEVWLAAKSTDDPRAGLPMHGHVSAESMKKQLLLPQDSCNTEDEKCFAELFFPPLLGEVVAIVEPCMMKSGTFKQHGKLYASSARLCFHSVFFGIEISISARWGEVEQVRLMKTEEAKTYPLRVFFKNCVDFDGTSIKHIDIRMFDLKSVGHVDRCVTYFIGSGLFGMWQDQDVVPEESPRRMRETGERVTDTTSVEPTIDVDRPAVIWQLERRTSLFQSDWRAPFLPHDAQKQIKWLALEDRYRKHPLIPDSVSDEMARTSSTPPIQELEVLGKMRPCTWEIITDAETDADGWQYAVDFYLSPDYWHSTCTYAGFDHVRRRRWHASFVAEVAEPGNGSRSRLHTTVLANKDVDSRKELFSVSIGVIPLDVLASAFEADDWQGPDQLMAKYFDAIGASDLDIGPWTNDIDWVKGKVRSIEMRVSVPPNPMCPKETRCTSTWHVVATSSKVVLENIVMSLDVPYGTYFNVITCDTFDVDDEGHTRFVRTLGIEWVKSTWLKGQVEAGVPPPATNVGHMWAKLIQQWAQRVGQLGIGNVGSE